jgi:hypothetical protein
MKHALGEQSGPLMLHVIAAMPTHILHRLACIFPPSRSQEFVLATLLSLQKAKPIGVSLARKNKAAYRKMSQFI